MKPLKITIPEPCNENWDKMTPDASGRFCLVCNKSVIDFTNKLPDEIQHFFKNNKDQEVCGRFKKSQLDSISFQIPKQVLYSQTQYHKMFLLALFVVMGTSLFSCASKNGNKQKIEKVEVVDEQKSSSYSKRTEETTQNERKSTNSVPICNTEHIMGGIPFMKTDQYNYEIFSLPKSENKKIFFQTTLPRKKESRRETEPFFPEGITEFYAFFAKEFKIPENKKMGKNAIIVLINENGTITYSKSALEIDKTIEQEIIRVLNLSPKWRPGKSKGIDTSKKTFFIMTVK